MSDRVVGLCVCVVALAFFASATQLEQSFFSDPLGSKAFPMLIASVAFIASGVMILSPDEEPQWPVFSVFIRLAIASLVLIAYAYSLKSLGFLLSTALAASAISYQIKPNVIQALIIGNALSIGLFVIFAFGLGLSLFAFPRGLLG